MFMLFYHPKQCFYPNRYFVLTASDLEEWYHNPESFHHEQDMVQWTEKLRPCAEALYIVLFHNHSEVGVFYRYGISRMLSDSIMYIFFWLE